MVDGCQLYFFRDITLDVLRAVRTIRWSYVDKIDTKQGVLHERTYSVHQCSGARITYWPGITYHNRMFSP